MSWLARLWPRRLTLGFGVAVGIAVIITEIIFLIPASHFWHKSNQREAIEEVRLAWYHASDPAAFLSPEHKSRLGQRMMRDGLLLGGIIFDSAGEPLAVFGERPIFDLNIARLSGQSVQMSPSSPALDVHFSPDQTGLSHHMVVRLPTDPIDAATAVQLRNFALSVLFIAGLTAVLVVLASLVLVIKPLHAINNVLRNAVENPDQADQYQFHPQRRDEIGQIADSLNMLLTSVSVVYQDELASLKRAIEGFGFAIMQFDGQGRMVAANPIAIAMFKQEDFDGLRRMNKNCAQPMGARESKPVPLTTLLGDSSEPMLLTLHTETGFFTGMGFGAAVRHADTSVMHRFVAIIDLDEVLRESRNAFSRAKKADDALSAAKTLSEEMRRLLESCLCLLDRKAPDPAQFEPYFAPGPVLDEWYGDALRDGLVGGRLEHGTLPPLSGDRQALRSALRQALLLTYAQSNTPCPTLKVEAKTVAGDQVEITVRDVTPVLPAGEPSDTVKGMDATLPTAALQSALAQAGGRLLGVEAGGTTSAVTLVLAAAKAEHMAPPLSQAG